jgi:hypothetical protein
VRRQPGRAVFGNPDIEPEHDPIAAEFGEPVADDDGLRDREAADHDSIGNVEGSLETRSVADPAAELNIDAGGHSGDERLITRRAFLRAVEIDDMDPLRP